MLLKNHIVTRFLTDDDLVMEMMEYTHPEQWKIIHAGGSPDDWNQEESEKAISFYNLVNKQKQSAYYVTDTVIDKLSMLKVQKHDPTTKLLAPDGLYDYTVFRKVPTGKRTFIFEENKVFRMNMHPDGMLEMIMVYFESHQKGGIEGTMRWDMFWVNVHNNVHSPNFKDMRIEMIETFIYKLLCFIFLTPNDEIIVEPGRKHGTKKQGKLINTLNVPITIVNSRWNTTVIRNEGFNVSAHFRLQRCGKGFQDTEIILIDAFQKSGYVRKAKSATNEL